MQTRTDRILFIENPVKNTDQLIHNKHLEKHVIFGQEAILRHYLLVSWKQVTALGQIARIRRLPWQSVAFFGEQILHL